MIEAKNVYLTTINVPKHMTHSNKFSLFVEVKAFLVHFEEKEPKFTIEVNNLEIYTAAAIIWFDFMDYVSNIVTLHFKEIYQTQ